MIPVALVERYSDAVAKCGPDSPEAEAIRTENSDNEEFLEFARRLDSIKRAVGGSGIDYPPCTRLREMAAEVVNRSPAVNGICNWKCEKCGLEWQEPEENDFDRTQDHTNWPVLCDQCFDQRRSGS